MDLTDLSQPELAVLAREYLLCGHLIDRAGMPYAISSYGREEMAAIAIDEWMGASPVYTRRMQRLLGFEGDDVATIFKGMQFDIGAPHGFLDFRYVVHDRDHGGFQLDHCGALMDVEPMGEDFVFSMCHDIEDPTFDATASATNPRARMRPLHRPPREPAGRVPHCAWTVEIDPEANPIPQAAITAQIFQSVPAAVPLPIIESSSEDRDEGRWDDYSGALVDQIPTEAFSSAALVAIIEELCLQQHLLAHSFMVALENRHDTAAALELGEHQFVGSAGMSAYRLAGALRGLAAHDSSEPSESGSTEALHLVADVLQLHPALRPGSFVAVRVERFDDSVEVSLGPCAGTSPESRLSWPALLRDGSDRVLEAIACAVDPHLVSTRVEPVAGDVAAWQVSLGDTAQPEQPEVELARFSTGTDFVLAPPTSVELPTR